MPDTTSAGTSSTTDSIALSISVKPLYDTHLLSSEEFQTLERLGPLFGFVKESSSRATASFLFTLNQKAAIAGEIVLSPMDCLGLIRASETLQQLLISPVEMDEDRARKLIASVEAEKLKIDVQSRTEQEMWQSMFPEPVDA